MEEREKAFVIAAVKLKIEADKKERKKIKAKMNAKGR